MSQVNQPRPLLGSAWVLPVLGFSACAMFGGGQSGLAGVDELVERVERVHVEAELAKDTAHAAVAAMQRMTAPGFSGDRLVAHRELVQANQRSTQQAEALRDSVGAMRAAAEPVFQHWGSDLLEFHRADMRQRSQARLEHARERYSAIALAAEPAQSTLDALNLSLTDVALFLGNDFTSAAVDTLGDDVRAAVALAGELDLRLDGCKQAALAYLEVAAPSTAANAGVDTPVRPNQ